MGRLPASTPEICEMTDNEIADLELEASAAGGIDREVFYECNLLTRAILCLRALRNREQKRGGRGEDA